MKIRTGFVSNSSSSSFIMLISNEITTEDIAKAIMKNTIVKEMETKNKELFDDVNKLFNSGEYDKLLTLLYKNDYNGMGFGDGVSLQASPECREWYYENTDGIYLGVSTPCYDGGVTIHLNDLQNKTSRLTKFAKEYLDKDLGAESFELFIEPYSNY